MQTTVKINQSEIIDAICWYLRVHRKLSAINRHVRFEIYNPMFGKSHLISVSIDVEVDATSEEERQEMEG